MTLRLSRTSTLLTATTALLVFVPRFADAAVDAEGATRMKSMIASYIEDQKKIATASGSTLTAEGDILVTPKDEKYYEIITPYLKTTYPGDMVYDFGKLAINVMPTDSPEEWKVSFSLPTPISIGGPKDRGHDTWIVNMGSQKASGIWNSKLNLLEKINASYQDISITGPNAESEPSYEAKIKSATINQNFSMTSDGKWSGPVSMIAQNISATADGQETFSMGEARADYTLKNVDVDMIAKLREQLKEIGENGKSLTDPNEGEENALALFDTITPLFEGAMGEVSSTFSFKNLTAKQTSTVGNNEENANAPFSFSIADGHFGMTLNQTNPPKSGLGLNFGMNGFKIDAGDEMAEYIRFIPDVFDVDFKVHDFPMAEMIKAGRTQAAMDLGNGNAGEAPQPPDFRALIANAGSTLTQTIKISAPSYKISGGGETKANAASPMGFTADQSLEIEGLDTLIAELNKNAAENPEIRQAAGFLTVLQLIGQQSPDTPSLRTYHLVVDGQGKATVNGSDLSSVLGAGIPQSGPQ